MTNPDQGAPVDELAAMRAELTALRAEVSELKAVPSTSEADEPTRPTPSRRTLLTKGSLAAVAGLAGAAAMSSSAAAADGDDIRQGTATSGATQTSVTASNAGAAFVGATSSASADASGVLGLTVGSGQGVRGVHSPGDGTSSGSGVRGGTDSSNGVGVLGAEGTGTASLETVVGKSGVAGVSTSTNGQGVLGIGGGTGGSGVLGLGQAVGVIGTSDAGMGVQGVGNLVGGQFFGGRAAVQLRQSGPPPASTSTQHLEGDIYLDTSNNLWLCVATGTPGTWQQLNSGTSTTPAPTTPTSSGFTPVDPFRVYDSRFSGGTLATGQNRTVSVENQINTQTGATARSGAVPRGTSAIACNVTVTGTSGRGFVAITPATASTFSASTLNWTASGSTVANSTFTTLDTRSRVKLFCGGPSGARTNIIIDVVGIIA